MSERPEPMSAAGLREQAERATGLSDFGDFDVLGALDVLCRSLNEEAALNALGRRFAEERLTTALTSRLQVVEDRKRIPEIAEQRIERPIVMAGLPRTGTTVLFNLLAQDLDNRAPMAWEAMLPSPPPERATYRTDPRIAEAQRRLDSWGLTRPEVYAIHPFGAELAEECPFLCEQVIAGSPYSAFWHIPGFNAFMAGVDRKAVFAQHRKLLQQLQVRNPAKRWLLKWSGHLAQLEATAATYPDAVFITTHRDMRKVLPSYISLIAAHRRAYSDDPRTHQVDAMMEERLAHRIENALAFREHAPQLFIDVLYNDLATDPMRVVRGIYDKIGLQLTPQTETRMQTWLADNRKGKHGVPDYSQASARLTEARMEDVFGSYMRRFGVPHDA